jgi:ferric-dicitrate binding protein FerR (iron transport regulator)
MSTKDNKEQERELEGYMEHKELNNEAWKELEVLRKEMAKAQNSNKTRNSL